MGYEGVISGRSRCRWSRHGLKGIAGPLLMGFGLWMAFTSAGCGPSYDDLLEGLNGSIRLETVTEIVNDPDLDEDEKRQALRDLGITDEELIDLLVREL